MRRARWISGGVGIALLLSLVVGTLPANALAGPAAKARHARIVNAPSAWQLYLATNLSRSNNGVHRVWLDQRMSRIAKLHSRAMATSHGLFHSPSPQPYLSGANWSRWGENVGFTDSNPTTLETAFMNSIAHRTNILDRRFKRVGIGAVVVNGRLWVTVFFYG